MSIRNIRHSFRKTTVNTWFHFKLMAFWSQKWLSLSKYPPKANSVDQQHSNVFSLKTLANPGYMFSWLILKLLRTFLKKRLQYCKTCKLDLSWFMTLNLLKTNPTIAAFLSQLVTRSLWIVPLNFFGTTFSQLSSVSSYCPCHWISPAA